MVDLGWSPQLHGEFDRYVNYGKVDRSDHKAERMGKKYQWIALHEFLALVGDHFRLKSDDWSTSHDRYNGPWQTGSRDIDPSCILMDSPNPLPPGFPTINWNLFNAPRSWNKNLSDLNWLKRETDLPSPTSLIAITDRAAVEWALLEGMFTWQEPTPPEEKKYELPTRQLWYMIKSYLVHQKEAKTFLRWGRKQDFMGRWMPESHNFHDAFLGEFPWAQAFQGVNTPFYGRRQWIRSANGKLPTTILATNDEYASDGSSRDCSVDDAIHIDLPAKWLVDKMKIDQPFVDGRFFDQKGTMVAFDPGVFETNGPHCLVFRKDALVRFLKKRKLSMVWTLLGEKVVIGNRDSISLGRLNLSGVFSLDDSASVKGSMNARFKPME